MSGCSKVSYRDYATAQLTLKAVQRQNTKRDKRLPTGVHYCSSCRAWHLTSKSRTQTPPWLKRCATRA
jgi:hypothetical protein